MSGAVPRTVPLLRNWRLPVGGTPLLKSDSNEAVSEMGVLAIAWLVTESTFVVVVPLVIVTEYVEELLLL